MLFSFTSENFLVCNYVPPCFPIKLNQVTGLNLAWCFALLEGGWVVLNYEGDCGDSTCGKGTRNLV